ncbi:HMG1/2 protein [Trifolium repens]|nr:HMG1/2 protein [Trifolium repens]
MQRVCVTRSRDSLRFHNSFSLSRFYFIMPNAKADSNVANKLLKRKGAGTGRKQTNKAAKDPNKPKRLS